MPNGSVIRVEKNTNYTIMHNGHLRDKRLTWKAKGLMSFMLSVPPEWDFSINGLVACGPGGKGEVANILCELEQMGYLHREQQRTDGKFGAVKYIIYEGGSPIPSFSDTAKPDTAKPIPENPLQINTNINKELKEINTNPVLPEQDPLLSSFEKFWAAYPKKASKPMAFTAWKKINPSGVLAKQIIDSVLTHRNTDEQWQKDKGKYIPMPSTFLNQHRWEDKVELGPVPSEATTAPSPQLSQDRVQDYMIAEAERYAAESARISAEQAERAKAFRERFL